MFRGRGLLRDGRDVKPTAAGRPPGQGRAAGWRQSRDQITQTGTPAFRTHHVSPSLDAAGEVGCREVPTSLALPKTFQPAGGHPSLVLINTVRECDPGILDANSPPG